MRGLLQGDQALRYTLLICPLVFALATIMLLIASRTVDADVDRAEGRATDLSR